MPTNTESLNPIQDRALGAFIGLAVGDALGTTIEFKRRDTYPLSPTWPAAARSA